MIVKNDGFERPGWALKDVHTGEINLVSVCENEREALSLWKLHSESGVHRPRCIVVAVLVTVTEA